MIIAIAAIDPHLAIGKDGKLPWHYPADMRFFKETTSGNAVVMGTATWHSIGRPLPNRTNIVVSRSRELTLPDGVMLMNSVDEVTAFAASYAGDVYIIGGAGVYESFAGVIDKWLITKVPVAAVDADTFLSKSIFEGYVTISTQNIGDGLLTETLIRKEKVV